VSPPDADNYRRELLLGCGYSRRKLLSAHIAHPRWWSAGGPVTLDINTDCKPDLYCDLNQAPPWHFFPRDVPPGHPDHAAYTGATWAGAGRRLYAKGYAAASDYWDEIHAYQVLEHLGRQGDAHSFCAQFAEIWRILKPNGFLVATVPSRSSEGLWGDPSHTRAVLPMHLAFLDQAEYVKQCDSANPTGMSDFRRFYKADFKVVDQYDNRTDFGFVLQAVKPSRWQPRPEQNSAATDSWLFANPRAEG
jgi:SAM-dependent methyltransferase